MVSCLLIFGEPHNGKTFTMTELMKIFNCKAYSFDFFISFIAELVRFSQENRLEELDQTKCFPSSYFENHDDLELFTNDMGNLISKNSEFFNNLYNNGIKGTIPNSKYDPKIHDLKNVINLGLIGDRIEQFSESMISSILNYLVKDSSFFIIEGFSFNKRKKYRKTIEKLCEKINYLESFYDPTDKISYYYLNDKKFITVTDNCSILNKKYQSFKNKITNLVSVFDSQNKISHSKLKDQQSTSEIEKSRPIKKPRKKYQSFSETQKGDSDSFIKINQLGIPENLKGKNVLDLGCNEGFYCFECEKKGAFAVGIEKNKVWYSLALERKQEFSSSAEFMNTDWNEIPKIPYTFDLVLFLAAFHYALNIQLSLLQKIYSQMNNNGLLILEVGLSQMNKEKFFIEEYVRPSGEVCQYPNKLSIELLLKDAGFSSVNFFGDGYRMRGDKFSRYIIHAKK